MKNKTYTHQEVQDLIFKSFNFGYNLASASEKDQSKITSEIEDWMEKVGFDIDAWTDIRPGDIFEGPCHPKSGNVYQCVEVNYDERFIDAIALFDGSKGHLVWDNSSPKKISKENADKFIEIFKNAGERGVMLQQGYDESFVDGFIKCWREQHGK